MGEAPLQRAQLATAGTGLSGSSGCGLPVLPQPAEIVLHPENKTDEKRGVEEQGRSNHPIICEARDKQARMPCIPSPLDQGKIELNKANYVLLMLVFLLKI